MDESLKLINTNLLYKKIFKEIYKKYKKYGKITGSFIVEAKDNKDKLLLANFDSSAIYTGKARIKCTLVQELFNRKLKDSSFLGLLETVVGESLETNKEKKQKENDKLKDFFCEIIKNSKEGKGKEWFITLYNEGNYGYKSIIRKYNEIKNKTEYEELYKNIILVILSLNFLPYLEKKFQNIAVFSAEKTRDPHFLDSNTFTGKLFIFGLQFIFNNKNYKSINDISELYFKAGILKDEISNHCTIFSLKAFDYNNKEILPINLFTKWKEPLEISISNLIKVKYLEAIENKVYVFENPAVFHEIIKRSNKNISLICTKGQINLSSYMLLDKIENLKEIYYAGDFDPEGLLIADKIKKRYCDKVKFSLYNKDIYEKIISSTNLSDSRISMIKNIETLELQEIKQCIKCQKKAAYQELLINDYLKLICK